MMAFKPISNYPPYAKLLLLVGFLLVHIFFFTLASFVLAKPIWGFDLITNPNILSDLTNPAVIEVMKFSQVLSQIGLLMGALLFVKLVYGPIAETLQIKRSPSWLFVVMSSAIIVIAFPVINALAELNGLIVLPDSMKQLETWLQQQEATNDQLIEAFLSVSSVGGMLLNVLLIALFTAIVEEVVFRGVFLQLFKDWFKSNHLAVLFSGVLFALVHFQFYKIIPMILMGVLLGYLYVWTKSLWIPIAVHFVNNAMTIIAAYYISEGWLGEQLETFGTHLRDIPYVLMFGLSLSALIYFIYRKSRAT